MCIFMLQQNAKESGGCNILINHELQRKHSLSGKKKKKSEGNEHFGFAMPKCLTLTGKKTQTKDSGNDA